MSKHHFLSSLSFIKLNFLTFFVRYFFPLMKPRQSFVVNLGPPTRRRSVQRALRWVWLHAALKEGNRDGSVHVTLFIAWHGEFANCFFSQQKKLGSSLCSLPSLVCYKPMVKWTIRRDKINIWLSKPAVANVLTPWNMNTFTAQLDFDSFFKVSVHQLKGLWILATTYRETDRRTSKNPPREEPFCPRHPVLAAELKPQSTSPNSDCFEDADSTTTWEFYIPPIWMCECALHPEMMDLLDSFRCFGMLFCY